MTIFNHVLNKIDYFIFKSFKIEVEYLGLYRIMYCLLTFFIYGVPNFTWIDDDLNYLFLPPTISITNLFSGFPDKLLFSGFNVIIVILHFMLLFGCRTKIVSILLFLLLLFCYSFSYSFGKIDHTILWLIIPFLMAFSGWGNAFSLDAVQNKKSEENTWVISVMALLLGFAMFTASVPKIMGGWLSPDSLATKTHLILNHLNWQGGTFLSNEAMRINSHVFWKTMDYLTVFFEFSFLIAILNSFIFRIFIAAAVIFHIIVFLTFNISFTTNLLTYLLFINWSIFASIKRSDSFQILINKIFKLKYLTAIVSCVLIYGIISVVFQLDFIFPSVTSFVLKNFLNQDVRIFNAFLLFFTALLVIVVNVTLYFRKKEEANLCKI